MARIDSFLRLVVEQRASDLHLRAGYVPFVRYVGELHPLPFRVLSQEEMLRLLSEIMNAEDTARFRAGEETDFAYALSEDGGRFRAHVFHHSGGAGAVFRVVPQEAPTLDGLMMPPVLKGIAKETSGLVLVTGPTGSGKTTTLAAFINEINSSVQKHIITIEDPIEYQFINDKSLINQREIGLDVVNFAEALRSAVREDPDVMLLGEMRDAETFETALTAAETGHLVFGTIHSSGAAQTIGRILDLFQPNKHEQIRTSLAFNLRCVMNQKLLASTDKARPQIPAVEMMFITPIIKKLILEGEDAKVAEALAKDVENGCENYNKVLARLYREKKITMETALAIAPNPEELKMSMRGITISDGGIV